MIFVFLLLSLMCSALNEIIEAKLKNRAKNLELGIRNLLGNDKLANDFFDHALIGGLFKDNKKPSYIPSRTFALALMNLVAPTAWLPKDKDTGATLTAGEAPVPVKLTVCGLSGALSLIVTAAVMAAAELGSNVTVIVQLDPALTLPPQLLLWLN